VFQESKLFRRQLDDTAIAAHFMSHKVECQITHSKPWILVKTLIATAEQSIDACQQLFHSKGFRKIVIGANVKTCDAVLYRPACREHEYWRHDALRTHLATYL